MRLYCKSETRTIPESARKRRNSPGNVWKRMSVAFKHETTHCVCFLLICTWMKRRLMSILILCPISPAANGEWIPVYPSNRRWRRWALWAERAAPQSGICGCSGKSRCWRISCRSMVSNGSNSAPTKNIYLCWSTKSRSAARRSRNWIQPLRRNVPKWKR